MAAETGRFAVVSGFLGSGKTTLMMALTQQGKRDGICVHMISNDLGNQSLADHRYASLSGCPASELVGECICYQTENLVEHLRSLYEEQGAQLVLSDIPGFGVGALEHVYHTLHRDYPACCTLAPFTVVTEPERVRQLMQDEAADLSYLLKTQLVEADVIVLNKTDLLSGAECAKLCEWLKKQHPEAQVLPVSAMSGAGLPELLQALMKQEASMHRPEIGYGGEAFQASMSKISEFYEQYHVSVCCDTFDGNAYLKDLAQAIRGSVREQGADLPHLKLLAYSEDKDYAKADLLGIGREIELAHAFAKPCTDLGVMLNGSALCPSDALDELMSTCIAQVSKKYQLEVTTFKKECFGMG
ncbi:MAG: hypothetical protein IJV26_02180 [Lachnospiraceae bacterium]|nr:hypothetical protein [Lachnospiraceae bacterium]